MRTQLRPVVEYAMAHFKSACPLPVPKQYVGLKWRT